MTPADFKRLRIEVLGLTQAEFAKELGLRGVWADRTIHRYESGEQKIDGPVKRCAELLLERAARKRKRIR